MIEQTVADCCPRSKWLPPSMGVAVVTEAAGVAAAQWWALLGSLLAPLATTTCGAPALCGEPTLTLWR